MYYGTQCFDVMYHGILLHIIAIIFENIHLYNQQLLGVYQCYTNCMDTDYSQGRRSWGEGGAIPHPILNSRVEYIIFPTQSKHFFV